MNCCLKTVLAQTRVTSVKQNNDGFFFPAATLKHFSSKYFDQIGAPPNNPLSYKPKTGAGCLSPSYLRRRRRPAAKEELFRRSLAVEAV